jgi:WD40 repeat protein
VDSYHHVQGIRVAAYIPELKQICSIDNITDKIFFYDENCRRKHSVKPKKENHIVDTAILYFAYSRIEKRIGACLQDYSLSFWDMSDNFTYEKTFSANLDVLQIFIVYIEYCTRWVTIDQKNCIYIWDIERESSRMLPKRHDERISDMIELTHLKLVAACSLDKKIIFWDIITLVPA